MNRKSAAKISLDSRFEQINLECLTKNDLPRLLAETAAAITENRIHSDIPIFDCFACPRAMAGIVSLQDRIGLSQVLFGVVGDFRYVQDIPLPHSALDLLTIPDKFHHLVCDFLRKEQITILLAFLSCLTSA
jgi:hypothetical protein